MEEIGKDYKISRERIRHIEKTALGKLEKIESDETAAGVFNSLREIVKRRGGVIGEQNLIRIVLEEENNYPAKGALFLALKLDGEMRKIREDNYFAKRWVCDKNYSKNPPSPLLQRGEFQGGNLERQVGFVDYLINFFNSTKKMIGLEEMAEMFREKIIKGEKMITEGTKEKETLLSYLEPSKLVEQNYFGQWGLKNWPEIKPRSIKDKIYLALKKEKRPLHFVEIAEVINEICRDKRLAKPQTVHNELIKDGRCVLIGRGIYALKEWGYQEGIVKEVITEILKKKNRAMNKDEIIEEVLEKRIVKKNTVLVNLKNHSCFVRFGDGKYELKN